MVLRCSALQKTYFLCSKNIIKVMLVNMEILGAILNGRMFQALQDNQFGAPLFPNSYTSLSLPFSIFVFCTCFK